MKIAELKRRLPVGTEFTGEFIGSMNTRVIGNLGVTNLVKPENERITRRRVLRQGAKMISVFLSGPKEGREIELSWKGVTACMDTEGSVVLTNTEAQPPEAFLRIRF